MTTLFSKPKTPDTSKQEALMASQDAELRARELQTAQADAATKRAKRAQGSRRASLITGAETGVQARETLG
jgi:hypothetical protein